MKTETIPVPDLDTKPADAIPMPVMDEPPTEPGTEPAGEKPKRRRRRKQQEPQEQIPIGATPEDLERCAKAVGMTFGLLSNMVAQKQGPHWRLNPEEAETLGEAWTAALEPYLPTIGKAVPWAAAVMVTLAIYAPRAEEDAKIEAERQAVAVDVGKETWEPQGYKT